MSDRLTNPRETTFKLVQRIGSFEKTRIQKIGIPLCINKFNNHMVQCSKNLNLH